MATLASVVSASGVPISVLTDSYKSTHFLQYPGAKKMVAYGEFRGGFNKDSKDTRFVYYGMRYIVENYLLRQWTMKDVEQADIFYKSHLAPMFTDFPFPRDLFVKFIKENKGYFPVKLQSLPEGTCANVRIPVYQVTAEAEYTPLCTFLETLLTHVWYPTTVATLSRRSRDVIEEFFDATADGGRGSPLVSSRLHDFGFRGVTCLEQSVVGGCAHLLSFVGTDTMSAAYYAQFSLNGGRPVGQSIPATEHSVMTAWPTEADAIGNMIDKFGSGIFACVMDSYDYSAALNEVIPVIAKAKTARGGFMVLRPDSGDPVEAVLMALHAAEKTFGADVNSKGFKVLRKVGVIQGDGINLDVLKDIAAAVRAAGFSADNVAYGMGGGLLQKVNRDTMSFATKLSHIVYADGSPHDVMKQPQTDAGKFSLPGMLAVKRVGGVPVVFPADGGHVAAGEDLLKVVYDNGPVAGYTWDDFDTVKARVAAEWRALPKTADVIAEPLKVKIRQQMKARGKTPTV